MRSNNEKNTFLKTYEQIMELFFYVDRVLTYFLIVDWDVAGLHPRGTDFKIFVGVFGLRD